MDYTKYDFDAIVGAEVEIGNQRKIFGKVVCSTDEAVVIQLTQDVNALRKGDTMTLDKGTIISLTAKITPRRMNLEQLKHFAKQEVGDDKDARIGMGVNVDVFYIQANFDKRQGYLFDKEYGLTDYIDCTDWGWSR